MSRYVDSTRRARRARRLQIWRIRLDRAVRQVGWYVSLTFAFALGVVVGVLAVMRIG